jgi:hypothetical protein
MLLCGAGLPAEVDRALWTGAVLRLGYVHITTRDLFVISPFGGEGGTPGVFGLLNTGKDSQVYRDFRIPSGLHLGSRKIRVGFYVINLTNHGNFSQVYNDVTSPNFGRFTEFERQQTAFLPSVVN